MKKIVQTFELIFYLWTLESDQSLPYHTHFNLQIAPVILKASVDEAALPTFSSSFKIETEKQMYTIIHYHIRTIFFVIFPYL